MYNNRQCYTLVVGIATTRGGGRGAPAELRESSVYDVLQPGCTMLFRCTRKLQRMHQQNGVHGGVHQEKNN